jgi:hypothetical protein
MDGIYLDQDTDRRQTVVRAAMNICSVKCGVFLDLLRNY